MLCLLPTAARGLGPLLRLCLVEMMESSGSHCSTPYINLGTGTSKPQAAEVQAPWVIAARTAPQGLDTVRTGVWEGFTDSACWSTVICCGTTETLLGEYRGFDAMLGSSLGVCEGCAMAASNPFWLRAEACNPGRGLQPSLGTACVAV